MVRAKSTEKREWTAMGLGDEKNYELTAVIGSCGGR